MLPIGVKRPGFRFARTLRTTVVAVALIQLLLPMPGVLAQDVPSNVRERSNDLDVPFVPSDDNVLDAMFEMAKPTGSDFLIDLGSGDGRIVIGAAKKFGLHGFGVDLNEGLVAIANQRARVLGVADRAQFYVRDLFKTDFSKASILTMYLLPEVVLELREKLLRDLRPGTRIVSHDYHLGDWRPDEARVVRIGQDNEESIVYYWMVPARVAGTWEWVLDSKDYAPTPTDFRTTLKQRYQDISGEVGIFPGVASIHDLRLAGTKITFSVTGEVEERMVRHDFAGTVDGDRIVGTVTVSGGVRSRTLPWEARRIRTGD